MKKYQIINTLLNRQRTFSLISWIFLLYFCLDTQSQDYKIEANELPLSQVVFSLIEDYNIQVTYNEKQLSKEKVSLNIRSSSMHECMENLLENTSFRFEKSGDVYIILKKRLNHYLLNGSILDRFSLETLPYAHILVNGQGLISSQTGSFSIQSTENKYNIQISYLGYYIMDTLVYAGSHIFKLTPSVQGLEEITIKGEQVEYSMEAGESAGQIRLNQKTARKIPGNGDNAVFNFLRLQPGILAAGEQSSDLIIWGGYEGHSKVLFDGFTLYGLKNFNDNISTVNPYMTKDILVLKGGYGAEYDNRVGGIVDISGISGSQEEAKVNLNVNNMTVNAMASIPVFDNSSLTMALRRTYYNLYNPEDVTLPWSPHTRDQADILVYPDYVFGDYNLKYSGRSKRLGSYFLSLYQGKDKFQYNLNQQEAHLYVIQSAYEANRQRGGAIQWNKELSTGLLTEVNFVYTELSSETSRSQLVTHYLSGEVLHKRHSLSGNELQESSIINKYYYTIGQENRHQLKADIAYINHHIDLYSNEENEDSISTSNRTGRISGSISDNFILAPYLHLYAGLRMDYPVNIKKVYVQPRFSIQVKPALNWNAYIAWGIYKQFITKTSFLDESGNYYYYWALADNLDIPVLHAFHYVGGVSYKTAGLTLSAEGYYKTTDGITRYVSTRLNPVSIYKGDSKSMGTDLLIKGRWRKHEGWVSYSLSKTLEFFPYFPEQEYRPAPHDQRHEVKTSILLNFYPLYISANYVYGSGFITRYNRFAEEQVRYPYNRMDVSVYYNFSLKNFDFEAGVSILNVFNTENIKYSNFIILPALLDNSINIHAEAVPFTPTLFLNMAF